MLLIVHYTGVEVLVKMGCRALGRFDYSIGLLPLRPSRRFAPSRYMSYSPAVFQSSLVLLSRLLVISRFQGIYCKCIFKRFDLGSRFTEHGCFNGILLV